MFIVWDNLRINAIAQEEPELTVKGTPTTTIRGADTVPQKKKKNNRKSVINKVKGTMNKDKEIEKITKKKEREKVKEKEQIKNGIEKKKEKDKVSKKDKINKENIDEKTAEL